MKIQYVDALGNLNGFFNTLASNIQNAETRKLLPIQENLLSADTVMPRESKAFIKIVKNDCKLNNRNILIIVIPFLDKKL